MGIDRRGSCQERHIQTAQVRRVRMAQESNRRVLRGRTISHQHHAKQGVQYRRLHGILATLDRVLSR